MGFTMSSVFLPGQLVVASLLNRNIKARLLLRDPEKATTLFGKQDEETLQVTTSLCFLMANLIVCEPISCLNMFSFFDLNLSLIEILNLTGIHG